MRTIIAVAVVLASAGTATAYQTEVKSGRMAWKREGLATFHEREARRARIAAKAAAEAQESTDVTPSADPVPSYPSGVLSAAQVASFARGAGFPEYVIPTMVAIAWRESRFNPSAINPTSGACGIWQMFPCPGAHALDPATNAALAFAKWQAGGLSPWGY